MNRIPELRYSLFAARSALRQRFSMLPTSPVARHHVPSEQGDLPRDSDVVQLLLDTTQTLHCDQATAIAEYQRIQAQSPNGLPDHVEAEARGWFRRINGKWVAAQALRDVYLRDGPPFAPELRDYVWWLSESQYHVSRQGLHASAETLETALTTGTATSQRLPDVLSPDWIAARLWDTPQVHDLPLWTMRWKALECPSVIPKLAWSVDHADQFRALVLKALHRGNLPGWDAIDMSDALRSSGDIRQAFVDEIPADALGRHLRQIHTPSAEALFEPEGLALLMGVLARELPQIEAGPVPSPTAQELVGLALRHPDLLATLVDCALEAPQVLADLVLCPPATALVCYLVATWGLQHPTNPNQRSAAADAVQTAMLEDCLDVLRHHLLEETACPAEYARLLIALQEWDAGNRQTAQMLPVVMEHLQSLSPSTQQAIRSELIAQGCADANAPAFAVVLKTLAIVGRDLPEADAATVAASYTAAVNAAAGANLSLLDTTGAGALAKLALEHDALRPSILNAVDVSAVLSNAGADPVRWGLQLREHIGVLSRAVIGYPESVPEVLVAALAKAIQSGARDRPSRGQLDAFTFRIPVRHRSAERRIEADLVDAVNRLENPAQQAKLIGALVQVEDPVVLAALLPRVPPHHHDIILSRLKNLTPEEASRPALRTQLQERVQVFLDIGLTDVAERYQQDGQDRLRGNMTAATRVQDFGQQLQLQLLRSDLAAISTAKIPADLPRELQEEAQRTLDFFHALALLKQAPPDAAKAASIFRSLYEKQRNPVYAINLLAARIAKLLAGNLFKILAGEEAAQGRNALAEVDRAIPSASTLGDQTRAVHVPNCATLLLATGLPREALRRLHDLAPAETTAESMAFEAVTHSRLGDTPRALALLRLAKERFGSTDLLKGAEEHIEHARPVDVPPRLLTRSENATQVRAALHQFQALSPSEQAEIMLDRPAALETVVAETFREALAGFQRTLSFLGLPTNKFHEDDYNGILAELVEARLEGMFGWQAHEQSPGGFTGAGNAGRRDFVLRRRGVDITVFEALKSDQPNDARLEEHLHKLFAYSTTDLYFHITYSFRKNLSEMVNAIAALAARPPLGTDYLNQTSLPALGARPAALRGAYRRAGTDVTVFFFVVDMLQVHQRQAVGAPQIP